MLRSLRMGGATMPLGFIFSSCLRQLGHFSRVGLDDRCHKMMITG